MTLYTDKVDKWEVGSSHTHKVDCSVGLYTHVGLFCTVEIARIGVRGCVTPRAIKYSAQLHVIIIMIVMRCRIRRAAVASRLRDSVINKYL